MKKNFSLILAISMVATFFSFTGPNSFAATPKYSKCFNGADLPGLIGKNVGKAKIARVGQKGVLTYGPYVTLQVGNYVAMVTYNVTSKVGSVVAVVDRGSAGKPIQGSSHTLIAKNVGTNKIGIIFKVMNTLPTAEVRVFDIGVTSLAVNSVCIVQTS